MKALFVVFILGVTIPLINLIQVLSIVTRPFSPHVFRAINRRCAFTWWGLCVWVMERVYGVELVISGDPIPVGETALVISNHQSAADIAVLFPLALRAKRLGHLKWFVKDVIKYVPGIGWGMLFLDCVFLKRNWADDQERIRATFARLVSHGDPFWLASFPEGTRLTPSKLLRNQNYAQKRGIEPLKHVLLPRTKGFVAGVHGLRQVTDAVYDITLAYEGKAPNTQEVFTGKLKRVHVHFRRHAMSSLPQNEEGLIEWLNARFREKDALLTRFKELGRLVCVILVPLLVFASSCARAPLKGPEEALRKVPASQTLSLQDDLPLEPLLAAVHAQIELIEKTPPQAPEFAQFVFGHERFTREEYLHGLKRFEELGRANPDQAAFFKAVQAEFDFYEVYGQKDWGEVFLTSYYEPQIEGAEKPTDHFSQPLYATPPDLLTLDLAAFDPKFAPERKLRARLAGKALRPFYSREEIDVQGALKGKKLELCWVDPVDAFFLQVQGSGLVDLGHGKKLILNYAEKNGQPYESLAKFLKGRIPADQMNLHTIEGLLRSIPRAEMQQYLNLNPSYVFFKTSDQRALTFIGVPATDGRTIATDKRYFPKGALALLSFDKPKFDRPDALQPVGSEPVTRFVLDQDVGGAIQGGGRVDLFWGRGAEAKLHAGAMKNPGKLYYLAPKKPV